MDKEDAERFFPFIEQRYKPMSDKESAFFTKLTMSAFSKVDVKGEHWLDMVPKQMPRRLEREPIFVYIQRHRSEFDYALLLTHLQSQGSYAITQAGHNLFIGPLDEFLRKKGAFKVLRLRENEIKTFYDSHWLKDKLHKFGKKLNLSEAEPVEFTKVVYRSVYQHYMQHLVEAGYDLQIFPGIEWSIGRDKKPKKNFGRSKTGMLNEFSPLIFSVLLEATKLRPIVLMPVNISYERVIEDTNIERIKHIKKKHGSDLAYLYDGLYNFKKCSPFQKNKPQATINYGEPIVLEMDSRRLRRQSSRYSELVRERVGRLETPYPIQMLAYSTLTEYMKEDFTQKIMHFFFKGEQDSIPPIHSATLSSIKTTFEKNLKKLRKKKVNLDNILGFDESIEQVQSVFDEKNPILEIENNRLNVYNMKTFVQYANHIYHLF